jgi:hypothetical protein
MSQGIEFNRLMLDMRAMQMDAMAQPKSVCKRRNWAKAASPICSASDQQGQRNPAGLEPVVERL